MHFHCTEKNKTLRIGTLRSCLFTPLVSDVGSDKIAWGICRDVNERIPGKRFLILPDLLLQNPVPSCLFCHCY